MLRLLTWNVFEMQLLIPLWWQTYYSYQLIKVNFRFSKTITVEYVFIHDYVSAWFILGRGLAGFPQFGKKCRI